MARPTDADLSAYVDGELSQEEAARIAKLVASDPELALRVAQFRRNDLLLRRAAGVDDDETFAVQPIFAAPPTVKRRSWSAAMPLMALVVGAGIGWMFVRVSSTDPAVRLTAQSGLAANTALLKALNSQASGVRAEREINMMLSFRAADGRLCRKFAVGGSVEGLACREVDWRVVALGQAPQPTQGYRTAGAGYSPVDEAIQSLGVSALLEGADELRALPSPPT